MAGRGIVLLPILSTLIIARGVLVAVIAALYAVFAWAAFRRAAWARPIGILVAVVNVSLVAVVLIGGDSPAGTLLWAVVPAIILVYLLTPAGRRAFSFT